jgi:hypothetical protein
MILLLGTQRMGNFDTKGLTLSPHPSHTLLAQHTPQQWSASAVSRKPLEIVFLFAGVCKVAL